MGKPVKIALAGINGYGRNYLNQLLDNSEALGASFVGIVDPTASLSLRYNEVVERKIPVYDKAEGLYGDGIDVDLLIIAAPIHLHLPISAVGVENGSNVLTEKPLCGAWEEAERFLELEKKSDGFIAVGYNWSFTSVIQTLKKDILKGKFGAPKRMRSVTLWPRKASYYQRNNWAGRIKTDDGAWVLDSPANNATAHYLHNMLYLLGDSVTTSAMPELLDGRLWRAKKTENYDSAAVRLGTDKGAEVFFFTTHSVKDKYGPVFQFEFEDADIVLGDDSEIKARFKDGSVLNYGNPGVEPLKKLTHCIQSAKSGEPVVCGVEAASAQTSCIYALQESVPIIDIPGEKVVVDELEEGNNLTWARGLYESFKDAYENWRMPQYDV